MIKNVSGIQVDLDIKRKRKFNKKDRKILDMLRTTPSIRYPIIELETNEVYIWCQGIYHPYSPYPNTKIFLENLYENGLGSQLYQEGELLIDEEKCIAYLEKIKTSNYLG